MTVESHAMKAFLFLALLMLFFIIATIHVRSSSLREAIKIRHLCGPLYFVQTEEGANLAASVGKDGILLIDTGWERDSRKIKECLKGIKDVPVKIIVNTHFHPDHAEGNEAFAESAVIISHRNARKFMQESLDTYDGNYHWKSFPPKGLPDITFDIEIVVHFNDEEIRLIHMPNGHTDNDIVVWFSKSRVVHLGDIFRHQRLPYLDIAAGASVCGLIRNLETLIREIPDDWIIIPGHGPVASKSDLQNYHKRLIDAVQYIEKQIDQGKPLDDVKRKGLPSFYDTYPPSGVEPDMWIEIVYKSLKGEI
jgi:cyclase